MEIPDKNISWVYLNRFTYYKLLLGVSVVRTQDKEISIII